MNLRPAISILIICLILQYNIGGLCANTFSLNGSEIENNSIKIPVDTTIQMLNLTTVNNSNNISLNYKAYPLNCPKWMIIKINILLLSQTLVIIGMI